MNIWPKIFLKKIFLKEFPIRKMYFWKDPQLIAHHSLFSKPGSTPTYLFTEKIFAFYVILNKVCHLALIQRVTHTLHSTQQSHKRLDREKYLPDYKANRKRVNQNKYWMNNDRQKLIHYVSRALLQHCRCCHFSSQTHTHTHSCTNKYIIKYKNFAAEIFKYW